MERRFVKDYVQRAWAERDDSRRAHWAEVYRTQGWQTVWAAAQSLSVHVRAIQPDFPGDQQRAADLAHHHALTDRFDRAAHAFARR